MYWEFLAVFTDIFGYQSTTLEAQDLSEQGY